MEGRSECGSWKLEAVVWWVHLRLLGSEEVPRQEKLAEQYSGSTPVLLVLLLLEEGLVPELLLAGRLEGLSVLCPHVALNLLVKWVSCFCVS